MQVVRTTNLRNWTSLGPILAILGLVLWLHGEVWLPSVDTTRDAAHRPRADLMVFYASALLIQQSPAQLYDVAHQAEGQRAATGLPIYADDKDFLPYAYPAVVALAFVPATFFSYRTAYVLMIAVNLILLGATLSIISGRMRLHRDASETLGLCAVASIGVYATLLQGQFAFLVLLLEVLVIVNLRGGRMDRAGMWAGFLAFKPQFLPVWLFWFTVRRHWRGLGYMLGIGGAIAMLSVMLVGIDGSVAYFRLSRQIMAGNFFTALPSDMPNLRALVYFFRLGDAVWLAAVAGVLLVLYRTATSTDSEYCTVVIAAILVAPHIQASELVLLLIPVGLVLAQHPEKIGVATRWPLFGLMLWQLVIRGLFAGVEGNHWPAMPLTLVSLFAYFTYRARRVTAAVHP